MLKIGFKRSVSSFCFACIFAFGIFNVSFASEIPTDDENIYISNLQHQRNKQFPREFNHFKLSNGLEVLIIQDPRAKKSSVSMSVAIGQWWDPPQYRGMAHYLEHMLFLGTAKYPNGKEYHEFIERNGGSNNAYTAVNHTNYYFEISSSALQEALDRFGHFFIDPTFNEELIPNEMKNVDSEYEKNVLSYPRKLQHVSRLVSNPAHPNSQAFQGNSTTLGNVSKEALLNFYKNYSADIMKLVVITPTNAHDVAKWISELYVQIPVTQKRELPKESIYREQDLARLVEIKPASDDHSMTIVFPIPSALHSYYSSPHALVSDFLNRSDTGSLIDLLKKQGLIRSMAAYPQDYYSEAFFNIVFNLTNEGRMQWKEICNALFQYISFLGDKGLSHSYFKEYQIHADLNFIYNAPDSSDNAAIDFANYLHHMQWNEIEPKSLLLVRYDNAKFKELLQFLSPQKMQIYLTNHDLTLLSENIKTDEFFDTMYRITPLSQNDLVLWNKATARNEMLYPQSNRFISNIIDLKGRHMASPCLVQDNEKMRLWVWTNHTFNKPVAFMNLELLTANAPSLREFALLEVYKKALEISNNKWMPYANHAGLSATLSKGSRGYALNFYGYSDKFVEFALEYIRMLKVINVTETEFITLRNDIIKNITNSKINKAAYEITSTHMGSLLGLREFAKENVAVELESITLTEVQKFAETFLKNIYVRSSAFGNITPSEAETIVEDIYTQHQATALNVSERPLPEAVKLPLKKPLFNAIPVAGKNHAWRLHYQFGETSPELYAVLKVGESILSSDFFNDLRTVKQIGYIVGAYSYHYMLTSGFQFIIQTNKNLQDVIHITNDWIKDSIKIISSITPEQFDSIKNSLIEPLEKEVSTFEELSVLFYNSIFTYNEDFKWKIKRIEALRNVTQNDVMSEFTKNFAMDESRKISVFAIAEEALADNAATGLDPALEITNIEDFKARAERYQRK